MKHKIIILITFMAAALSLNSCTSDFLNTMPTDAVPDKDVDASPKNALKVFNGAWRYMFDTFFTYANPGYSAVMRQDDMMGNDVVAYPGKYGFSSSYQFKDTPDKTVYRTRAFWTLHYKVIDNCNRVISITSSVPDAELSRAQGMAYALRAFTYFSLVQHYRFTYSASSSALAVPVYTEPTTDSTQPRARSSVQAVYTRVLDDLAQAADLLHGTVRTQKFEPDAQVVDGLYARVYLVLGDWEKSAAFARSAREGYPLMSAADYMKGFNDVSNSEWIWGHPQTPEQSVASYSFNYLDVSSPAGYYYSFMSDPHFRELFSDPADIRLALFEWIRDGYLGYKKFLFKADNTADIVLMRSAEMYLIEAEAKARNAEVALTEAVIPLNELRKARGMSPLDLTGKTREELIDEILLERRKELWGEGFSMTDILRLRQSVERKPYQGDSVLCRQIPGGELKLYPPQGHYITQFPDGTPFTAESPYYLYAIPEAEENANPDL